MQPVPQSLFDQPSDERQTRYVIGCRHCSRSQSLRHFCKDLLLYVRVLR